MIRILYRWAVRYRARQLVREHGRSRAIELCQRFVAQQDPLDSRFMAAVLAFIQADAA
jgi:hypothetical protein